MKHVFSLIFVMIFTSSLAATASASPSNDLEPVTRDEILSADPVALNPAQTCLDEYATYKQQLARRAGWGPLFAVLGIPVETASLALGGAAFATYVVGDTTGWMALGMAAWGTVLGIYGGAATFVGLETSTIIRYANTKRLMHVIDEAYVGEGKHLSRFVERYAKQRDIDASTLSTSSIASLIVSADQKGQLCDGSLVSPKRHHQGKKLKQRLANRRELMDYIDSMRALEK